ncbi:hypothetical protein CRM73_00305 [Kocuria sp. CCUG 69068]|uniref:hypothetical protein n=1 Tax=Kocuria sp. CCUG 69068 TaxID=2043138 RepID=UPI001E596C11|nr:hypothetical protein [Kocuria sp. CCUG 69068]
MTTTAPRLILAPQHSQELRARHAPRFGERPKAVTLGPEFGLPMARYYVHPDGSLTRPRDELSAAVINIAEAINRITGLYTPAYKTLQAAAAQTRDDFTKGA